VKKHFLPLKQLTFVLLREGKAKRIADNEEVGNSFCLYQVKKGLQDMIIEK
jgi:hypothetical protein